MIDASASHFITHSRRFFANGRLPGPDMPRPQTIAIVDDDDGVRSSLASLVLSAGYSVRTYRSGREFLNARHDMEPDCIVSDLRMPELDGEELHQCLVRAGRRLPIIFFTGFSTDIVRRRLVANGAHCVLQKPSDGETILRSIENALGG